MEFRWSRAAVVVLLVAISGGTLFAGPGQESKEVPTLIWYVDATPQRDTQKVMDQINAFLPKRIGAKLDVRIVDWGEFDQKMQLVISTGEEWDLAFTSNWANGIYGNVSRGAFLRLDDYLPKYAPDLWKHYGAELWNKFRIEGGIYAVVNGWLAEAPGFMVRADLAKTYNVDLEALKKAAATRGLAALGPFLQTIKDKEPGIVPFSVNKSGWMQTYYLAMGIDTFVNIMLPGAVKFSDPAKVINQFELPEFLEHLKLMREWNVKGFLPADAAITDDVFTLQAQGKAAAGDTGYTPFSEAEEAELWGDRPIFAVPIGDAYLRGDMFVSATGVNPKSPRKELAVKLLNQVLISKELYNLLAIGIKDVHYQVLAEDPKTGVIQVRTPADSGFAHGVWWEFMDGNAAYFSPEGTPINLGREKIAWNTRAKASPVLGFHVDQKPIQTEMANLTAVAEEYFPGLVTGSVDPEKVLPQFIKALKAAGVDKALAEMQRQLDAWRKR